MADFFIENPDRLKGQPKRTIADYVEGNGILVPRRFDTLAEARKSHKAILLRSEHPQEYDGVSGLLDSLALSDTKRIAAKHMRGNLTFSPRGLATLDDVKNAYLEFGDETAGTARYKQLCKYLSTEEGKFREEMSFSIWEQLSGVNRVVVADTAIPNRHHVISYSNKHNVVSYAVVENGEVVTEHLRDLPEELRQGLENLTNTYERVRHLGRFDPEHCPIMEFQTYKGRDYFLQYHRGRDFSPVEFRFDGGLESRGTEVPYVRGATPKEGMTCKVTVYYVGSLDWNMDPKDEDGSYDFHNNLILTEMQVRGRKVQMNHAGHSVQFQLLKLAVNHDTRSKLFKPQVSIVHKIEDILRNGESVDGFYQETKNGDNASINLYVVSDGRRAYIERI